MQDKITVPPKFRHCHHRVRSFCRKIKRRGVYDYNLAGFEVVFFRSDGGGFPAMRIILPRLGPWQPLPQHRLVRSNTTYFLPAGELSHVLTPREL